MLKSSSPNNMVSASVHFLAMCISGPDDYCTRMCVCDRESGRAGGPVCCCVLRYVPTCSLAAISLAVCCQEGRVIKSQLLVPWIGRSRRKSCSDLLVN